MAIDVRVGLAAADVTSNDVALISSAEATLLAETHVIVSDVAVVFDGIGPIAMRTPVRPDGVEDTVVRLLDVGPTAEMLARALLRPFFGITATSFATSDESDVQLPGRELRCQTTRHFQPKFDLRQDFLQMYDERFRVEVRHRSDAQRSDHRPPPADSGVSASIGMIAVRVRLNPNAASPN